MWNRLFCAGLCLAAVFTATIQCDAIENGKTRWLVACGVAIGFAFLAKMLQAFLVVPGLGLAKYPSGCASRDV